MVGESMVESEPWRMVAWVPPNLQNRSLTVQGRIRVIWDEDEIIPELEESPELMRTTLVERGCQWLMPESCESMMKKEELNEQFFDDDAAIPSIAIFRYEPEDMGFFAPGYKKLENRDVRKNEVETAIDEITPTPPEEEVEDEKEEEKTYGDFACELRLSPMDVDKVLVNGVELT